MKFANANFIMPNFSDLLVIKCVILWVASMLSHATEERVHFLLNLSEYVVEIWGILSTPVRVS